ncbi:MAG TPA: hypothetical protein VGN88_13660, partial [Phycisphaerae bacterium]
MSDAMFDKIARALLYEGYMLYPYRPSVKNHQRWTFGGVYPPAWSAAAEGTDPCAMQTQVLLEMDAETWVHAKVRFLQLVDRKIGKLAHALNDLPAHTEPEFEIVPSLEVGPRQVRAWQEAMEREVDLGEINIQELLAKPRVQAFEFSKERTLEPLRAPDSPIVALLIRSRETIVGQVELSAASVCKNVVSLKVRIANGTPMTLSADAPRDEALIRTMVSTHTILQSRGGSFISQTDPPAELREAAARCANIGAWPVLVGTPGQRDKMLSSPIIVEDYPRIAPESPGDLFDSGEIDEILTLRIMTLTDEEKRAAAGVDERVRDLLTRTESLARDQLMSLHGTLKEVVPSPDFFDVAGALPAGGSRSTIKTACIQGVMMKIGDPVRLRPLGRADGMDMMLDGKSASIVSIEQDFEDRIYVAVVVDDDPGRDLGLRGQPGHRFFFGIEEV